MAIRKVGLGWVTTANLENSKKFFSETLGLKITYDQPEFAWFEVKGSEGGVSVGVGGENPQMPFKAGTNAIMTFTVDDIVAEKAELEGKGITFHGDIVEVPGSVKMATFADPDGNIFQLVEDLT